MLTIDPGDTVVFRTLDSGWGLEPHHPGPYRPRKELEHDGGHALVGPVAIRGARPGMTLKIEIGELIPGPHGACLAGGWESAWNEQLGIVGDGIVHSPTRSESGVARQTSTAASVPLRPFLGVMGVAARRPRPALHHPAPHPAAATSTARELVTAGPTLCLPIEVEGALFS